MWGAACPHRRDGKWPSLQVRGRTGQQERPTTSSKRIDGISHRTRVAGIRERMLLVMSDALDLSVGEAAAALGRARGRSRWASRFVLQVEACHGIVTHVHVILATPKLTAIRFDPL